MSCRNEGVEGNLPLQFTKLDNFEYATIDFFLNNKDFDKWNPNRYLQR